MGKEPVIILGYGGNAVDFFDTVSANYEVIGFVDDDNSKHQLTYNGIKVYGRQFLETNPSVKIVSLIGSEGTYQIRHEIINAFNISASRFATCIHPKAIVSSGATIGKDVVIMPGVVITSNAKIGDHIFILANTVIHHDSKIGDYTLIGSNVTIAGHVNVGRNCFIGSGSSLKNNIEVGAGTIVGMGSNVLKSIPEKSKVAGNPARPI
jgi:sugar O-acyltransferase (sialic acid O-acetyltransferase NeuD family)